MANPAGNRRRKVAELVLYKMRTMIESDPLDPHPPDRSNQLPAISPSAPTSPIDVHAATLVPALIADAGDAAGWRYVEFFTAMRCSTLP